MVRYFFLGVLTAFLFLATIGVILYVLDQGDVVDLKPSVLIAFSHVPGWEGLMETYELGMMEGTRLAELESQLQEQQVLLEETARELEEREATLAVANRRLETQRALLEQERGVDSTSGSAGMDYGRTARLLEAMDAEMAGETLLGMEFEVGVAVLKEVNPRRAGRI